MTAHLTSQDILDAFDDATEWTDLYDATTDPSTTSPQYASELAAARQKSGATESIRAAEATIAERRVAIVASEFAFMGGSLGERACAILAAAVRRATERGLPLIASPVSGGTRMQEGALAFLQLATLGLALTEHKAAGLPYLVYLRSPTTGGTLASWASLGHLTVAQPEAFLAFLGPRVVETITGEPIADGVQRAEHLQRTGVVDRIADLPGFVAIARDTLAALAPAGVDAAAPASRPTPAGSERDVWADVEATRAPGWPDVTALVAAIGSHTVEMVGPEAAMSDGAAYVAWSRIGDRGVVVVGFRGQAGAPYVSPADLARVRSAVADAAQLGLPVVAVIDLVGGELTAPAEEGGIAREIARSLAQFVAAPVPTVGVLLGKGTGGVAFAIGATDRVIALEGAWLAPLQPEGASAILYRDGDHAAQLARSQGIGARELGGYVDTVATSLAEVGDAVAHALADLAGTTASQRHAARVARYARLGR
ncbi:carboxyl transferase domain-containing protein [Serinibacter salmoneus]|uniref:Acetyl-CoA carboxylase carboxyl transferase subunit beta n=1 Tax=Serinibacter salmoneus TaxID=556530 RepID=A0A2A9D1J9_9MICO|nr:carboxyl transferase domain-containing protein [Serinibacter salmoneus]PFG19822.1 acetyl-CoA carboxylase carboxyl transferase subunit beta [Serinibacter salmoneus]